jgi:transposase, IS30 family
MPTGYQHLTYEERCQIYALKQRGDSLSQIARQLRVHKSTVSRELRRNSCHKSYCCKQADARAQERRKLVNNRPHKMRPTVVIEIEAKLNQQWSPEQISGWLARHKPEYRVSHETIYRHVWADKRSGGILFKQLRHHGKKYNKRGSGKAVRGCIPNRVGIEERPIVVDDKSRAGDWEIDTVSGRKGQGAAIVSMVDRASKLTKLAKVPSKNAKIVAAALMKKLKTRQLKGVVLTITADNGKEFAYHEQIRRALGAMFFFANPYHSWERGLNEHTNGLIRQYFPKGESLDYVTQEDLDRVEILLNSRPRKVLNYATPMEVFNQLKMQARSLQN